MEDRIADQLVFLIDEREQIDGLLQDLHAQHIQVHTMIQRCERERNALSQREAAFREGHPHGHRVPEPLVFAMDSAAVSLRSGCLGGLSSNVSPLRRSCEFSVLSGDDDGNSMDEWEDCLGGVGIAKCQKCGSRLPLEAELIDKHSQECVWTLQAQTA